MDSSGMMGGFGWMMGGGLVIWILILVVLVLAVLALLKYLRS